MIRLCFVVLLLFGYCRVAAQKKDYRKYHSSIIEAEQAIFIDHNAAKGLQLFKRTFDNYDFVFTDDCIEAFQLALYYKQEQYAMQFIKKALDNGFELHLFRFLDLGCPCDGMVRLHDTVKICRPFLAKHQKALETYSNQCYGKFLKTIDKNLYTAVLKRHVKEQVFKNYIPALGMTKKQQEAEFEKISNDNLRFMDSLGSHHIFLGEKNLGIYTDKLNASLGLPFKTIDEYVVRFLKADEIPVNTYIPVHRDLDYFEPDMVYTMLYHNKRAYDVMAKYKDEAIAKGYMHPREYAYLQFWNRKDIPDSAQLYLTPTKRLPADIKRLDEKRKQLGLCSYELDTAKHAFAHAHDIRLFYGMFRGIR